MGEAIRLRDATADDMPQVARLYGHYVASSLCTFEEGAPGAAEMRGRLEAIRGAGLPWRIAESGGAVAGYAYAGRFRSRSAYRYTLENSVYVAHDRHGRGIGLMLMRDLIAICTALGYRQMVAFIGDSANEASLRLHARLGFRTVGCEAAVGLKFGRWVDVVAMQLALGEGGGSLPGAEPAGYPGR